MKRIFFTLLAALLLSFFAQSQTCQYLLYESFSGTNAAPLNNTGGGTGWGTAWYVQNGNNNVPGYQLNGTASLAYQDLKTVGIHASGGHAYLTTGRDLDVSSDGPFEDFLNANGAIGQNGTEIWASALLSKQQNDDNVVHLGWHNAGVNWCEGCTSTKVAFGYFGAASNVGGQRRWTLRVGNNYYPTTTQVTAGQEVFFVVRLAFGATDSVHLYLNPATLGDEQPAAPTLSVATAFDLELRHFYLYLGNSAAFGRVDELRMATTYRCVAPDADVPVNQPPTATFTATPLTGQRPLTISFDGSASFDPEGPLASRNWHFADGSPDLSGTATATHTFTALGQHNVSFSVADQTGLEHTAYRTITVLDENGTFPCGVHFTLADQATCGQNNGRLLVNNPPATFALRNSGGAAMPLTGWNTFQNLPPGIYQYTGAGANGCRDTFQLHVPVDSNSCAGWQPDVCNMGIGMNLTGLADWTAERPFRNLMKQVREETLTYTPTCFCWNLNVWQELSLDANGYPTSIPQNTSAGPTLVRWVLSANGGALEAGKDYVLLYDGQGSIEIGGSAYETSDAPGRIQFHVASNDNIFMNLTASTAGNYVRNLRMLRLSDEFVNLNSLPFHTEFLNKIAPYKALRFMDWGATNFSPNTTWANRSKTTWRSYGTERGVPYEMMIKLANVTNKDVWICVPHAADSAYIAQMALLFKNTLEADRKIYLEYSNEVWNWLFSQAHYNNQNKPDNLNYGRAYAEKANRVFKIWYNVFGASAATRVKRVLGMQLTYNYLNEQILSHLDPADWDCASPTFYFGIDRSASGNPVLNAASTPEDILTNAENAFSQTLPVWRLDYNQAKLFGKEIINYEGGQHFTDFQTHPYQQAMYAAYRHPRMYQLYDRVIDSTRAYGSRLAMAFSNVSGQEDIYVFGHLGDIEAPKPYYGTAIRYETLLDNISDCSNSNCIKPGDVKEFFLSPTSVRLRWDNVGATQYELQYRQMSLAWQTITVSDNQHTLTGLVAGRTYQWRVRAQCGNTWTAWTAYRYFYTPNSGACTRPTQLVANQITANSVLLAWEPQPDVAQYQLDYKPSTSSTWTSLNTTATQQLLTGLLPATTYQWRLRSQCSYGWTPFNSPNMTFRTKTATAPREDDDAPSLDKEQPTDGLVLFPNPSSGETQLAFYSEKSGEASIEVADWTGKVLHTQHFGVEAGENASHLQLNALAAGPYHLRLLLPDGTSLFEKLIKI